LEPGGADRGGQGHVFALLGPTSFADKAAEGPEKRLISSPLRLAFTLAPHLQPINHRGCFSPLAGI
jgi:hypothetical protein